ncbi:MAG: EAL domain-containing protein [Burkholderiales bacterium]|nr:EAL domain-containing protein [Burkholderiales bacterium]
MTEEPKVSAKARLDELLERVRAIASTLPDVVWSVAVPSHKIIYVSPAAEAVFGKTDEQMSKSFSEWSDLLHPDDRGRVLEKWEHATHGAPFEAEYRIVTPQGGMRWIQTKGRCATDADGDVVRIDGMARDVTERREHEERISHLTRIRSVLSGINSIIVRVREREDLLRETCRIAVEQGGFGMVWIGLLDAGGREVKVAAHHGFAPDVPGELKLPAGGSTELQDRAGCRAILDGIPVIVNDLARVHPHNELRRLAVKRGYRSVIALPLIESGATAGVMIMYAKEIDFFNADEVKLLSELAGDISLALEHIGIEERLKFLANYDPLTGLPNRALMHERLTQRLAAARQKQVHTAVAVADVKRFRLVNETFGRHAGDRVLRELAQRLRAHGPESLELARVSPDSFALVLTGTRDAADIATTLERCVGGALAAPFLIDGEEIRIAMTTGVAVFPPDGDDAEVLFRNAEAALKRAKRAGDRILFYQPEMNARVAETLILENRLRRAVQEEQFVLHYQPKISAVSGRITGLEALIRWLDPGAGLVPPGKFIPVLEETGMILDVGTWAIRKALIESRNWRLTRGGPLRIAVNVSAIQLRQRDFVDTVKRSIDGLGIAATHLDLELTESMVMEDIEENVRKLQAVRDMGVNVAVDDFGTGYSSLAYLAKLPVNALKIDRTFVDTMTRNPHSMTLVSTIISLAHALDLKVIAEGVESEEQAKLLRLLKCDELQGYLFSKPLAPGEVQDFLMSRGGGTQVESWIA